MPRTQTRRWSGGQHMQAPGQAPPRFNWGKKLGAVDPGVGRPDPARTLSRLAGRTLEPSVAVHVNIV